MILRTCLKNFKDQAVKELIALYTLEHCKEIESVKRYPRVRLCDTKNKNNVAPECQRYISKQYKHNSSNTNHLKSVAGRSGTYYFAMNMAAKCKTLVIRQPIPPTFPFEKLNKREEMFLLDDESEFEGWTLAGDQR